MDQTWGQCYIKNAAGAARVPRDVPVQRDVHRLEPVAAVRRPLPHPRARRQLPAAARLHRPARGDRDAHIRMPQVRLKTKHYEPCLFQCQSSGRLTSNIAFGHV